MECWIVDWINLNELIIKKYTKNDDNIKNIFKIAQSLYVALST